MSSHLRTRLSAWQYAVEREVAPHVEERWAEAVLLELRLNGVSGDRIGEVLAEVDSHCAESGHGAAEAFGDPVTYARSLDLRSDDGTDPRALLTAGGLAAAQVLGMFAVLWSFPAWLRRQPLELTTGHLVATLAFLVLLGTATWRIDAVLRVMVRHPVGLWCAVMAYVAVLVVLLVLLDEVLLRPAGATAMALGGVLLLAGGIGQAASLGDDAGDDPVRSPVPGAPPLATRANRAARLVARLTPFLVPAFTLLMLLPVWLMTR